MTVLVAGVLSNIRTRIESSAKVENLIAKPKVEEDLIEPKKTGQNWTQSLMYLIESMSEIFKFVRAWTYIALNGRLPIEFYIDAFSRSHLVQTTSGFA